MRFEVIVGNVGTVYSGPRKHDAMQQFHYYRQRSRDLVGRAAGENVTLMVDGDIRFEYQGTLPEGWRDEE